MQHARTKKRNPRQVAGLSLFFNVSRYQNDPLQAPISREISRRKNPADSPSDWGGVGSGQIRGPCDAKQLAGAVAADLASHRSDGINARPATNGVFRQQAGIDYPWRSEYLRTPATQFQNSRSLAAEIA
jgi:hypothetical protein